MLMWVRFFYIKVGHLGEWLGFVRILMLCLGEFGV